MTHITSLLLTRPRTASEGFAQQVEAELGRIPTVISPLLEIDFLEIPPPENNPTIVFTSRNGVAAWARAGLPSNIPCFCVGQATGNAARGAGFDAVCSGGTVTHLLNDLLEAKPKGEIIHVHGRHTRGDLVGALRAEGLTAKGLLAYEQNLMALSTEAKQLLQGGARVIVPLFSPRIAAQFAKAGPFGPQIDIIAISEAAANECPNARIAAFPDAKGMIAAISQGYLA
ncbi:MAG: uroporphyrinogen-III synthase [Planktotalea sp.]|uniref:uroporphyrinogen-III synthase n=1 Tax=Planktotalea sp. TaxID=2029877 RepID=UPI003C757D9B